MEQEEQSYESYARNRLASSPLAQLQRGAPVGFSADTTSDNTFKVMEEISAPN